jgi:hypothetical protein
MLSSVEEGTRQTARLSAQILARRVERAIVTWRAWCYYLALHRGDHLKLVLADVPTNNLDKSARRQLVENLRRLTHVPAKGLLIMMRPSRALFGASTLSMTDISH